MAKLTSDDIKKAVGGGSFVGLDGLASKLEGALKPEAAAAIADLTDNSTGSASDTIAAITDGATKDAVASLSAKVNAILAALRANDIVSSS